MENNTSTKQGTISNPSTEQLVSDMEKNVSTIQREVEQIPVTFECSIRRKIDTSMTGLPGADPADRRYYVSSTFNGQSGTPLKGIEDELEKMLMPGIVAVNATANEFNKVVSEYWANIRVLVPADNDNYVEHERGKVCKVQFIIKGKNVKAQYDSLEGIENKIHFIQRGILKGVITLNYNATADFLLLSLCLKHSRVANKIEDVGKSGKVFFYLYEKTASIKAKYNMIQMREKANRIFSTVQDNEEKLNALLIEFGDLPSNYDSIEEKVIALDEFFNRDKESMARFVIAAEDKDWQSIYLLKLATRLGKLTNPQNTTAYYYNNILLGRSIKDSILYLTNGTEESDIIKKTLEQEVNFYIKHL